MSTNMTCGAAALGLLLACGALAVTAPSPAHAEEYRHHEFREHDVHRFERRDLEVWRGGMWRHEWHNGRFGWWWFAGGVWYFYDQPVYPYPLVVSGMSFVEPAAPVMVPQGPPVGMQGAPPPGAAPQPQVWYYCDNPAGYYPYVPTCSVPFRPVPARPQ